MQLILPTTSQLILQIYTSEPNGAQKTDIVSASVRVYHIVAGAEIEDLGSTAMSQVGSTNKWRYVWTAPSLSVGEYLAEYTVEDAGGIISKEGELINVKDMAKESTLSLIQSDLTLVKQVEAGRWKIVSNQMVFYDSDNTTPLLTFNLKDASGVPSMTNVFERTPA